MEVILLNNVDKLGRKGEVVRVRDGYGRNFLIPRGYALESTEVNQVFVAEQKERAAKRFEKEKKQAEEVAAKLGKVKLKIDANAGEQDKLFGSVTAEDVQGLLEKKGYSIDKKDIHLSEPIKALGQYTVTVEIFPQVKVSVPLEVLRKD